MGNRGKYWCADCGCWHSGEDVAVDLSLQPDADGSPLAVLDLSGVPRYLRPAFVRVAKENLQIPVKVESSPVKTKTKAKGFGKVNTNGFRKRAR